MLLVDYVIRLFLFMRNLGHGNRRIKMSDVNKVYEEFWKFIIELDGEIDFEQVKRELYDYRIVMQEVSKVYCEITDGTFS